MSRRKVRCLDLFFRAQSAVCGSCSLPAYSCQTLCNPAEGSSPAPLSMEFSRQEYQSGFPFSSFIVLLHSVTLSTFYFFFKAYLFCLCWVFVAVSGLSLVAAAVHRLLLAVASLVLEHRLQRVRASIVMAPGLQGTGSVIVAHGLSCSEASSGTWDGTRAPNIGRHILSHCTTRELLNIILFQFKKINK